ncbi:collagen-like triple helix repeat-containing protein [Bdellovibrio reynosensis]|uniref:Collagen-like protein n=1 Tax=Bdellovibrio reynosensis TaxID=2835041 RepID=A0ABY4CCL7_9BACT|nr:collagen-like protein [Bdellovibrio reynosensis]UOF01622.1 collagen-like protein [Bdellovibrio reynosensis]
MNSAKRLQLLSLSLILSFSMACQNNSTPEKAVTERKHTAEPENPDAPEKFEEVVEENGLRFTISRKVDLKADLSNKTDYLDNHNIFIVSIGIEKKWIDQVEVYRTDVRTKEVRRVNKEPASINNKKVLLEDSITASSSKIENKIYKYTVLRGGEKLAETEFQIQPDLYIPAGTKSLADFGIESGEFRIGTLLMENQSRLVTQGKNVKLITQKFIVQNTVIGGVVSGARIETFTADVAKAEAAIGEKGRDGGTIVVETQHAQGNLTVYLRGTKGGAGYDNANPGEDGNPGEQGYWETSSCDQPDEGSGSGSCRCLEGPGNGYDGEPGEQGHPGDPGKPGGNSGSLEFRISKNENFKIQVERWPGSGGVGGKGSPGGKGGKGGAPGNSYNCPRAKSGKAGPQGPEGEAGDFGPTGKKEKICVQNDEQQTMECLAGEL